MVRQVALYVCGSYTPTRQFLEIKRPNPLVTGDLFSRVSVLKLSEPEDLERMESALEGARLTFEQVRGGFFPLFERLGFLRRLRVRLEEQGEAMARNISFEVAKPIRLARTEVRRALATLDWTLIEAERELPPETIPTAGRPDSADFFAFSQREPKGPVLAISPFNFPLNLIMHKLAPALAAGCPLILKPSPKGALVALHLTDLCHACELPAGMLSTLVCDDDVTMKLATDSRVPVVSFTGSAGVGEKLLRAAVSKDVVLECGGAAPVFINADADLERAADACVLGAFTYSGQVCISIQNIFIAEPVRAPFERLLKARTETFAYGPINDEKTLASQVIDVAAGERLRAARAAVLKAGGRVVAETPAYAPDLGPDSVAPALFTGLSPTDALVREELFGPYAFLFSVADLDEFTQLANAFPARLQTSVFTRDLGQAFEATRRLHYGGVLINESPMLRLEPMPYGGEGSAGRGREGPRYAMESYTAPKSVIIRMR